jgi:4-diphosphocytidyl-2-C-methyl-D-erythritol kinase
VPGVDRWVWPAPAKINLFLHVIGRRADGYHSLQTMFQLIDLADSIDIRVDDSGEIQRVRGIEGLPASQDLAVRAALLLQRETGCSKGAEISIEKRIPVGAGLGGGSSDAATVLLALNTMWDTRLDVDRLARLGLYLGADVPVFVRGASAWADGVGEVLTPLAIEESWYAIVFPEEMVETAGVFADPALTRDTPQTTIPRFPSGEHTSDEGFSNDKECLQRGFFYGYEFRNDLQPVVLARYPRVAAALGWLSRFGLARMSGSGGSVFLGFANRQDAFAVARQCPEEWKVFVTRGISRSPLLDAIKAWRDEKRRS